MRICACWACSQWSARAIPSAVNGLRLFWSLQRENRAVTLFCLIMLDFSPLMQWEGQVLGC